MPEFYCNEPQQPVSSSLAPFDASFLPNEANDDPPLAPKASPSYSFPSPSHRESPPITPGLPMPPLGEAWRHWAKAQLQWPPTLPDEAEQFGGAITRDIQRRLVGALPVVALAHPCQQYLAYQWAQPAPLADPAPERLLAKADMFNQLEAAGGWLVQPPNPYTHASLPVHGTIDAFLLTIGCHALPEPVLIILELNDEPPRDAQTLLWLCELTHAWRLKKDDVTGHIEDSWVVREPSAQARLTRRMQQLLQVLIHQQESQRYTADHPLCRACPYQAQCHSVTSGDIVRDLC